MNQSEIEKQFDTSVDTLTVVLDGFKRHYGQLSDFRTDEFGDHGNVLTIEEDEGYRCNGILITELSEKSIERIKERESGYELRKLSSGQLEAFRSGEISVQSFYVAVGCKDTDNWNPLRDYMRLCEEGAKGRGNEFYDVFRKTTYRNFVSDKRPHS